MSADFFSIAVAIDPRRGAELLAGFAAAESEYNGNVYVEATEDAMALAGDALAMSSNYPTLVAIDRFVARPAGIRFLDNRACRWIPPDELTAFQTAYEELGDRAALIARVAPHLGDLDDVGQALDQLERAIARAARAGHGVLVVCVPC